MDSVLKKDFFTCNLLNYYNRKANCNDIPKYRFTSSKPKSLLWSLQKLEHLGRK